MTPVEVHYESTSHEVSLLHPGEPNAHATPGKMIVIKCVNGKFARFLIFTFTCSLDVFDIILYTIEFYKQFLSHYIILIELNVGEYRGRDRRIRSLAFEI